MEFNYSLLGYESYVNNEPQLVLVYGFAGLLAAILGITILSYIFRKTGLQFIVDHLFKPLLLAFGFALFITLIPTLILYFLVPLSGVKLAYIWLTLFLGITIFCFVNYTMITKWTSDISKSSMRKEFRARGKSNGFL